MQVARPAKLYAQLRLLQHFHPQWNSGFVFIKMAVGLARIALGILHSTYLHKTIENGVVNQSHEKQCLSENDSVEFRGLFPNIYADLEVTRMGVSNCPARTHRAA